MTKRKTQITPAPAVPADKAVSSAAIANAIQAPPDSALGWGWPGGILTLALAREADDIPAWGTRTRERDKKLREMIPGESTLSGALATLAARNAAMGIELDGPERSVNASWDILHAADQGRGMASLVTKLSYDIYTQDNCAYMGIARERVVDGRQALDLYEAGKPLPAVVGLEHLDAANCIQTGDPLAPVLYLDIVRGTQHLLPWHMVHILAEMPSAIAAARGLQYCALTRVLKSAQFMRDVTIYRREKVSGRNPSQIQIVGGPSNQAIEDAKNLARERGDNRGFLRYMEPLIIASLDPTRPVSVATLEWASLPDGFDYDTELKNYITILALGLLEDYQTFAPLTGGALGAGQQSITLERKGRGKGPGLWRKLFSHMMNFYGVLPRNVTFSFDETDVLADKENAEADAAKIKNVTDLVAAGLVTVAAGQQMLNDAGIIDDDVLAMMGSEDMTPDTTRTDEETAADIDTEGVMMTGTVPLALPAPAPAPAPTPEAKHGDHDQSTHGGGGGGGTTGKYLGEEGTRIRLGRVSQEAAQERISTAHAAAQAHAEKRYYVEERRAGEWVLRDSEGKTDSAGILVPKKVGTRAQVDREREKRIKTDVTRAVTAEVDKIESERDEAEFNAYLAQQEQGKSTGNPIADALQGLRRAVLMWRHGQNGKDVEA